VKRSPQRHLLRVDEVYAMGRSTVIVAERLDPLPYPLSAQWRRPSSMAAQAQYRPSRMDLLGYDDGWGHRTVHSREEHYGGEAVVDAHFAIARDMLAAGILECQDAHRANVMVRPGTGDVVLSDLGCSRSSVNVDPPRLLRPGIDDGDGGDVHVDPAPPKARDPREVPWPEARKAAEGDRFQVVRVDQARGMVVLERLPRAEPTAAADGWGQTHQHFTFGAPPLKGKEMRWVVDEPWVGRARAKARGPAGGLIPPLAHPPVNQGAHLDSVCQEGDPKVDQGIREKTAVANRQFQRHEVDRFGARLPLHRRKR
jgi:hypothetical protein